LGTAKTEIGSSKPDSTSTKPDGSATKFDGKGARLTGQQVTADGGAGPGRQVSSGSRITFGAELSGRTTANREVKSFTANFQVTEKRYITGIEIALAAMISAVGPARIRPDLAVRHNTSDKEPPKPPADSKGAKLDAKSDKALQSLLPDKNQIGKLEPRHQDIEARTPAHSGLQPGMDDDPDQPQPENLDDALAHASGQYASDDSEAVTHSDTALPDVETSDAFAEAAHSKAGQKPIADQAPELKEKPTSDVKKQPGATMRIKTLVSAQDTLVSIAETFFHDPNVAWLIADLNADQLKETWMDGKRIVELKTRQQLELPVWQEISDFLATRKAEATPNNLVTIVMQSAVDKELLRSNLGTIFEPGKQ
jgi:hypothetical protein